MLLWRARRRPRLTLHNADARILCRWRIDLVRCLVRASSEHDHKGSAFAEPLYRVGYLKVLRICDKSDTFRIHLAFTITTAR